MDPELHAWGSTDHYNMDASKLQAYLTNPPDEKNPHVQHINLSSSSFVLQTLHQQVLLTPRLCCIAAPAPGLHLVQLLAHSPPIPNNTALLVSTLPNQPKILNSYIVPPELNGSFLYLPSSKQQLNIISPPKDVPPDSSRPTPQYDAQPLGAFLTPFTVISAEGLATVSIATPILLQHFPALTCICEESQLLLVSGKYSPILSYFHAYIQESWVLPPFPKAHLLTELIQNFLTEVQAPRDRNGSPYFPPPLQSLANADIRQFVLTKEPLRLSETPTSNFEYEMFMDQQPRPNSCASDIRLAKKDILTVTSNHLITIASTLPTLPTTHSGTNSPGTSTTTATPTESTPGLIAELPSRSATTHSSHQASPLPSIPPYHIQILAHGWNPVIVPMDFLLNRFPSLGESIGASAVIIIPAKYQKVLQFLPLLVATDAVLCKIHDKLVNLFGDLLENLNNPMPYPRTVDNLPTFPTNLQRFVCPAQLQDTIAADPNWEAKRYAAAPLNHRLVQQSHEPRDPEPTIILSAMGVNATEIPNSLFLQKFEIQKSVCKLTRVFLVPQHLAVALPYLWDSLIQVKRKIPLCVQAPLQALHKELREIPLIYPRADDGITPKYPLVPHLNPSEEELLLEGGKELARGDPDPALRPPRKTVKVYTNATSLEKAYLSSTAVKPPPLLATSRPSSSKISEISTAPVPPPHPTPNYQFDPTSIVNSGIPFWYNFLGTEVPAQERQSFLKKLDDIAGLVHSQDLDDIAPNMSRYHHSNQPLIHWAPNWPTDMIPISELTQDFPKANPWLLTLEEAAYYEMIVQLARFIVHEPSTVTLEPFLPQQLPFRVMWVHSPKKDIENLLTKLYRELQPIFNRSPLPLIPPVHPERHRYPIFRLHFNERAPRVYMGQHYCLICRTGRMTTVNKDNPKRRREQARNTTHRTQAHRGAVD